MSIGKVVSTSGTIYILHLSLWVNRLCESRVSYEKVEQCSNLGSVLKVYIGFSQVCGPFSIFKGRLFLLRKYRVQNMISLYLSYFFKNL